MLATGSRGTDLAIAQAPAPPAGPVAAGPAAVRAYSGDVVLHVGGNKDGPTGTARLYRELELNWTVTDELAQPSWPGIPDQLTVWRRNSVRHALHARDRCPQCSRFTRTGTAGRCDHCAKTRPAALALRSGPHRIEYSTAMLRAMPAALRAALEASPNRILRGRS